MGSVDEWWIGVSQARGHSRKAMSPMLMLISWELWKERNARVFRNTSTPSMIIVDKILDEASLWVSAGAKGLDVILPRE